MKKMILFALTIALAMVLTACGGEESADQAEKESSKGTTEQASQEVKITDEEKVNSDKVVSQINGEKIKGEQYNASYAQTKTLMSQYGQDVSDTDKVKEQVLKVIVEQELLMQAAKKQGIEVTDKEVQKEFESIKKENADQFASVLKRYKLTEESYKDQLKFELTLKQYVKQEIEAAKVTDKEVNDYYAKLKEQSKDKELPKLEEIKEQIKTQLEQQKQTQKLQAKVEELKKNADIKHMI